MLQSNSQVFFHLLKRLKNQWKGKPKLEGCSSYWH